jgi:hypothetical protein
VVSHQPHVGQLGLDREGGLLRLRRPP